MSLTESVVFIKGKDGSYRGLLEVNLTLEYIEAMRERKVPDASITDRLRNELTDILIEMDSAIQNIAKQQSAQQEQAPLAQPKRPLLQPQLQQPKQRPIKKEVKEQDPFEELDQEISNTDEEELDGVFDDEA